MCPKRVVNCVSLRYTRRSNIVLHKTLNAYKASVEKSKMWNKRKDEHEHHIIKDVSRRLFFSDGPMIELVVMRHSY